MPRRPRRANALGYSVPRLLSRPAIPRILGAQLPRPLPTTLSPLLLALACTGEPEPTVCTEPDTWYRDRDGDGYGTDDRTALSCDQPEGYADNTDDCDDDDPDAWPGAEEIPYDGIDQDCDGAQDASDLDGDGFDGEGAGGTDCDDEDATVYPGAEEICADGAVNDCEAANDDAAHEACDLSGTYELIEVANRITGIAEGDWAGRSVAAAGDINADGYDDILVGAYLEGDDLPSVAPPLDGESVGTVGAAWIILGGPELPSIETFAEADTIIQGAEEGHYAGRAISGLGDVDGDGFDDVLVGAFGDDQGGELAGAVYVFGGSATGIASGLVTDADTELLGETEQSETGYAASRAGDLNDDGFADLIVGAPHEDTAAKDAGRAYVFLGSADGIASGSMADADVVISGAAEDDHVGEWVDDAGDVNGDGFSDLVLGAYKQSGVGEYSGGAYLVLGSAEPTHLSADDAAGVYPGEAEGDRAGVSVSGLGDLDGDGYGDFAVGAYEASNSGKYAGSAYVMYGTATGVSSRSLGEADAIFTGEDPGDNAGISVSDAGDLDGDGFDDLAIGARNHGSDDPHIGAAYIWLGGAELPLYSSLEEADLRLLGAESFDHTGEAVAGAGDLDGNGYDDLLIGAPHVSTEGMQNGAVYILGGWGP